MNTNEIITDARLGKASIFDSTFSEADYSMINDLQNSIDEHMITEVPIKRQPYINENKTGRNELCPCGSGKKYKYCCGK